MLVWMEVALSKRGENDGNAVCAFYKFVTNKKKLKKKATLQQVSKFLHCLVIIMKHKNLNKVLICFCVGAAASAKRWFLTLRAPCLLCLWHHGWSGRGCPGWL